MNLFFIIYLFITSTYSFTRITYIKRDDFINKMKIHTLWQEDRLVNIPYHNNKYEWEDFFICVHKRMKYYLELTIDGEAIVYYTDGTIRNEFKIKKCQNRLCELSIYPILFKNKLDKELQVKSNGYYFVQKGLYFLNNNLLIMNSKSRKNNRKWFQCNRFKY